MPSQLYKFNTYRAPIQFLFSRYIREYDLYRANISILLDKGIIDEEMYESYNSMDRMGRQIAIGNLQKDTMVSAALSEGFLEARQIFIESNNLQDSDILSIKKDAIYVIDKIVENTKFGNLKFVCKNTYTSYCLVDNKEIYYSLDAITGNEVIDVKGISDTALDLHKLGMVDLIREIFYTAQTKTVEEVITLIQSSCDSYVKKELIIDYYREFNAISKFRLMSTNGGTPLYVCPDTYIDYATNTMPIDITYNYYILSEFFRIFSTLYFMQKK